MSSIERLLRGVELHSNLEECDIRWPASWPLASILHDNAVNVRAQTFARTLIGDRA